jgi:hypothetical protein
VFSHPVHGDNVSLRTFLQKLNSDASKVASESDKFWRLDTVRLHWYQLDGGQLYSDWGDSSQLPDLVALGTGVEFYYGFGGEIAFFMDRYGNRYFSVGGGVGFGAGLTTYWEGYATGRGPFYKDERGQPYWTHKVNETTLKDIVEGPGFQYSLVTPLVGASLDVWHTGLILLFGGINPALELNASFGWTFFLEKDREKAWDWVDDPTQMPRYDSGIKSLPNPSAEPRGCDCE